MAPSRARFRHPRQPLFRGETAGDSTRTSRLTATAEGPPFGAMKARDTRRFSPWLLSVFWD
jgi:hypothetical protein